MTLKTDHFQVGVNVTAANNFIVTTDGAGAMKIQRGNIVNNTPVPTQDILSVDANGNVTIVSGVLKPGVAKKDRFVAHLSADQAFAINTYTKIIPNVASLNPNTGYNTALGRFTPDVAGWYDVGASLTCDGTTTTDNMQLNLYKNGAAARRLVVLNTATTTNLNSLHINGMAPVYLNGTTDYIEMWAYRGGSGTPTAKGDATGSLTYFWATLRTPD